MHLFTTFLHFDGNNYFQCFHKRNLAMRTWRSKALQWEKETFWVKCGLNADLFQSFCGLMSSYIHQNFERSLKSAYLRNYTFRDKSPCVHYSRTIVYNPIFQEMHVQDSPHPACCFPEQLLVCYLQLCNSGYKRENETFCVKCSLIADHFSRSSPQLRPFMVPLKI